MKYLSFVGSWLPFLKINNFRAGFGDSLGDIDGLSIRVGDGASGGLHKVQAEAIQQSAGHAQRILGI